MDGWQIFIPWIVPNHDIGYAARFFKMIIKMFW